MSLISKLVSPAFAIAAGSIPGPSNEPWWSNDNGVGGVSVANSGHQIDGYHVDAAFVEITVSAWASVAKIEILADVNNSPHGDLPWVIQAPVSPIMGVTSPYLDFTGGRLYLLAAAETKPVRIALFCDGAKRFRVGIRSATLVAGAFACTGKVGFIQRYPLL